uniref:Glycine N-acyltransferase-like protein n=1 Tax=Steinernema glaseri TaxID=37863 RepID=A0A1I7Z381_9BILA
MCHPCAFQNHLFVLEDHRRRGLGNAVEMRLSQLCVKNEIVPFKTVEFWNETVIASTNKNSIWTRWDDVNGSPVHLEYRQFYPKENYPTHD